MGHVPDMVDRDLRARWLLLRKKKARPEVALHLFDSFRQLFTLNFKLFTFRKESRVPALGAFLFPWPPSPNRPAGSGKKEIQSFD
jgi:hypothetical protein